jgi:PKD repeat protein
VIHGGYMRTRINTTRSLLILTILVLSAGTATGGAFAQAPDSELIITLDYGINCGDGAGEVEFYVSWDPSDAGSYLFFMDFGDGDTTEMFETEESELVLNHTYTDQGDYEVMISVGEIVDLDGLKGSGLTGNLIEVLTMEGPEVTLLSDPAPPIFVAGEDGQVVFSTETAGGTLPYVYEWDLGGGESLKVSSTDTASAIYQDVGKYEVNTKVTDGCGFTASASMSVVVAESEDACHPTAKKIADAVNSLLPDQAEQEYSCKDIYTIFDNEGGNGNLGFGRMWMAYRLAETIDLTWEEINAWHMDESGWGSLLQLNRFTEVIGDQGIGELMALVMSEDYTLSDVRSAVRSVTRFEAEFDDALSRIADGATSGDLSQFYKLAAELGAEYETLDGYLVDGMTISELRHAANFADRMEVDWTEVVDIRSFGDSWGELKKAFALATDEVSAEEILAIGVQDYSQEKKSEEQFEQVAAKLAEQYSSDSATVANIFNGVCAGKWACVRSTLRDQTNQMSSGVSEKDSKTALQIGLKYGYSEQEVLSHYSGSCGMDWACTRTYFRNMEKDSN